MENWHLERLRDSDAEFRAVAAKSLALDVGHEAAVQLLLDIFIERESSHEDRVSALSALAELGAMGSVIDVLLQAQDMDALSVTFASSEVADRVRPAAIEAVKQLGDPRVTDHVVQILIGLFVDPQSSVLDRIAAVEGLAELKALRPLVEALVRAQDAEALAFVLASRRSSDRIRLAAIKAVKSLGDARVIEWLLDLVPDDPYSGVMHEGAIWALGELREPRAVEKLLRILTTDAQLGGHAREEAAVALGRIGDPRVVEPLISALRLGGSGLGRAAAVGLDSIADTGALIPALGALRDARGQQKSRLFVWADTGIQSDFGAGIARREHREMQEAADRALKRILSDARAAGPMVDILREAATRGDEKTTEWVSKALVALGPAATESLVPAVRDAELYMRWTAAQILGKIGDVRSLAALESLRNDPDDGVREAAAVAIERIQGGARSER